MNSSDFRLEFESMESLILPPELITIRTMQKKIKLNDFDVIKSIFIVCKY